MLVSHHPVGAWKYLVLALAILPALAAFWVAPPEGLSTAGLRAIGVAWITLTLWFLAPVPLAATGLLAVVLLPALGIVDDERAFSYFGNRAVFFLLGVFILTGALIRTGLSKRAALLFLSRVGQSPSRLVLGVLVLCSFLALWMPEHAVAAMAYPVVLEITRALGLRKGRSPLGTALFLALAWGAISGGVGTLLGGARAPLALEIAGQLGEERITFATWARAAVPISVIVTAIGFLLLRVRFRAEVASVEPARRILSDELALIGKMRSAEWRAGLIALTCIALWITLGDRWGLALISVGAAVAVFFFRIARWRDLVDYVNWNVIVMYGGAIALGKALVETGAASYLAQHLPTAHVIPCYSGLGLIMSQAISNAAAVVVVLPAGLGLAENAPALTIAIAVAAGLAYCFPVSTPANAIIDASGFVTRRQMAGLGVIMMLAGWIVLVLASLVYWPHIPGLGQ